MRFRLDGEQRAHLRVEVTEHLHAPAQRAEGFALIVAAPLNAIALLVERIGLPGIVGVILGGLLVGPFVLGWVERDGAVERFDVVADVEDDLLVGRFVDRCLNDAQRSAPRPRATCGATRGGTIPCSFASASASYAFLYCRSPKGDAALLTSRTILFGN